MSPPLLLKRAHFLPLGPLPPGADTLLIQDGRIAAIGHKKQIEPLLAADAAVVDLKGKFVLPGFIDTHVHLAETGLLSQGLDLSRAKTIAEVLEMLREAYAQRPEPGFFRAHSLDPSLLVEDRYPRREELDVISSRVPIFVLRRDGHSAVVNTAFYRLSGLSEKTPGVEIDALTGKPTGTLRSQALEEARGLRSRLAGQEDRAEAVRSACWQAVRRGVTTVHAMCAREEDVDLLLRLSAELPVDVVPYLATMEVSSVTHRGLRQIGGDLLADGSLGSHTAALGEPYADRPQERGLLYYSTDHLVDFVTRAHRAGLQVAIHAIGDRAVEQVLSAYEAVLNADPRPDHRHRIEHAELLTPEQIERMAQRGLVLAVQPAFEAFWGGPQGMYARRLGPQRAQRTNPYRHLVQAGVVIAGGSDSYITPIDPLAGVAAAVNHPNPQQRLSPVEGLRLFTSNGAYAGFQEDHKGSLRVGMKADLAVLSADPGQVSAQEISRIGVHMVIRGGQVMVGPEPEMAPDSGLPGAKK